MSHTTVTPQELARRRQAAARQNLDRALADRERLLFRCRAHTTAAGQPLVVAVPEAPAARNDTESLDRAAESLRAAVRRAEQDLESSLAAERRAVYDAAYADAQQRARDAAPISTYRSADPIVEHQRPSDSAQDPLRTEQPARTEAFDVTLARVVARLPDRCRESTQLEITRLVALLAEAQGVRQAERVLNEIRTVVQSEQDAQKLAETNRRRVDRLLADLDGAPGEEAGRLRGYLRAAELTETLPKDLEIRVEQAAKVLSAEEQADVVAAVRAWLEAEGYAVDVGLDGQLPPEGVVIDHPASTDHGVLVRSRKGSVLLNVVRFDEDLERDATADLEAEQSFCTDVASLASTAAAMGVTVAVDNSVADGVVQVMEDHPNRRQSRGRRRQSDQTRARKRR